MFKRSSVNLKSYSILFSKTMTGESLHTRSFRSNELYRFHGKLFHGHFQQSPDQDRKIKQGYKNAEMLVYTQTHTHTRDYLKP